MKNSILFILLCAIYIFATPAKDSDGYYLITNKEELQWLSDSSNTPFTPITQNFNIHARITKDIDFGGEKWIPICAGKGENKFTGILDGQNHVISNLLIDTDSIKTFFYGKNLPESATHSDSAHVTQVSKGMIQNTGFIGTLKGTVRNLNLSDIVVINRANGGEGISPTANPIEKAVSVGSIVGWSDAGTIDGSVVHGDMSAIGKGVALGGIVGNAGGGTIKNTISRVQIRSASDTSEVYIGGIVGYTKKTPTIQNVTWDGEIIENTGKGESGGIIGYIYAGTPSVASAVYNADGVENAVGKTCANCSVKGTFDQFTQVNYGPYKILTYPNKKVAVLFDKYKGEVQPGIFEEEIEVDSVFFERRFTIGTNSTISFPFSYSADKFSGGKLYVLDSVKQDGTWTAYISESKTGIEANKPYIIIATDEQLTFHGKQTLSYAEPGETYSTDGSWRLFSVYNYITGADRGEARTSTYGFAAMETEGAKVGEFKRMGTRAYSYPFRVLLEHVDNSGSLSKSANAYTRMDTALPDKMDVVISETPANVDSLKQEEDVPTEEEHAKNDVPMMIWKPSNKTIIGKTHGKKYNLLGRRINK